MLKTEFNLEHTPLLSLSESVTSCQGIDESGDRCGDEVDPGVELCPSCRRAEDRRLDVQAWERDGHTLLVTYPHLTD